MKCGSSFSTQMNLKTILFYDNSKTKHERTMFRQDPWGDILIVLKKFSIFTSCCQGWHLTFCAALERWRSLTVTLQGGQVLGVDMFGPGIFASSARFAPILTLRFLEQATEALCIFCRRSISKVLFFFSERANI